MHCHARVAFEQRCSARAHFHFTQTPLLSCIQTCSLAIQAVEFHCRDTKVIQNNFLIQLWEKRTSSVLHSMIHHQLSKLRTRDSRIFSSGWDHFHLHWNHQKVVINIKTIFTVYNHIVNCSRDRIYTKESKFRRFKDAWPVIEMIPRQKLTGGRWTVKVGVCVKKGLKI